MFVTAGFDELERKLQRGADRLRVLLEERRLTKAEINLGALGWQQVDDFPPEIEEQMRAIHAMERQQADLSNQSADMRWNIDALQLQRKQLRKNLDDAIGQLDSVLGPLITARDEVKKLMPDAEENIGRFDAAILELEKAHEELGGQLHSLMQEAQTLHLREEIVRLGEKRAAYDNEKEDLQRSRMKIAMEVRAYAEEIAASDSQIRELRRQIHDTKAGFEAQDKELLSQIHAMEKKKENAVRHVDTLDRKKSSAFLAIGRCLADSDIPPMNQPEALDHVFAHREKILALQQRIADSLAHSAQVPGSTMIAFYTAMTLFILMIASGMVLLSHSSRHSQP